MTFGSALARRSRAHLGSVSRRQRFAATSSFRIECPGQIAELGDDLALVLVKTMRVAPIRAEAGYLLRQSRQRVGTDALTHLTHSPYLIPIRAHVRGCSG